MAQLWQHPYVNLFKHFNISSWKKSTKEGEVSSIMDKGVKCTVYRITGSIPAGNYIQLPKTGSQSLGLTGRYFYMAFKPIPSKYFVVHIDVATQDNLVVRISFSNLFKEFKSTSTWLQFPFVGGASKGSVHSFAAFGSKDHSGPAPLSTKWTVLCLDFQYILSMYLNRKFSYLKGIRLCANMLVKNVFTSDQLYEPGLTVEQAKKSGIIKGLAPLPRDLNFPVLKGDRWLDHYDFIRFPVEAQTKSVDGAQPASPAVQSVSGRSHSAGARHAAPRRVDVSRCVSDRVSMIHNITKGKEMVLLLKEYLSSGDISEATRCLRELEVPHFHHELVYEASVMVLEEGSERAAARMCQLLKSLNDSGVISPQQMSQGFQRVFDNLPDICLDVPTAYTIMDRFAELCHREGVLSDALYKELPQRGRKRFVSEGDGGKVKEPTL